MLAPVATELAKRGATIMEPDDVADAVVSHVFACRAGQVFLPQGASKVSLLRGLPNWVQEAVRLATSKGIVDSVKAGGMKVEGM